MLIFNYLLNTIGKIQDDPLSICIRMFTTLIAADPSSFHSPHSHSGLPSPYVFGVNCMCSISLLLPARTRLSVALLGSSRVSKWKIGWKGCAHMSRASLEGSNDSHEREEISCLLKMVQPVDQIALGCREYVSNLG